MDMESNEENLLLAAQTSFHFKNKIIKDIWNVKYEKVSGDIKVNFSLFKI